MTCLQYYAPDYELDVRPSNMENANSQDYLQKIKIQVIENLRQTTFAPSVQMTDVPRDPEGMNDEADAEMDDLDEDENQDSRYTKRRWDKYIEKDGELSDSEDEEESEANGVRRQPNGPKRRRNLMDFQNPNAAADDNLASGAVSAQSGRSHANGVESNADESEREDINGADEDSLSERDGEEEDVDMADGAAAPVVPDETNGNTAQEATPPESPASIVAAPVVPAHVVEDTGIEAMDEGDTLEDPDDIKEEGREEREKEDVTAEKAAEVVERREEP